MCHQRTDEGLAQLPDSTQNHRSLRATNIEKHFKVSHNEESHKVKVLAKIYFSITG
jgi:hypothetical protein